MAPLRIAATLFVLASALPSAAEENVTELAADQAELARRFEQLETLAKRIAELTEADDPARAEQLRDAIRKSQELALADRFDAIVELLRKQQLAAASGDQAALAEQLQVLLRLLLADPDQARAEAERKRLEEMLKALDRQILVQQGLRKEALGEADAAGVAERQASLAQEVDDLRKRAAGESGQSDSAESPPGAAGEGEERPGSGGPPPQAAPSPSGEGQNKTPTQRAGERLSEAGRRMLEAVEKLQGSNREAAQEKQAEAQRQLEDAREEVEQALRQLREEEMQRRLATLATRLRRMLAEQVDILTLTEQTEEDRPNRGRRATVVAASGLANREEELVKIADGALRLLSEDGASIAFPEVIEQVREDMRQAEARLRKVKLGAVTQRLEQEIVDSLEEAIDSLDKTLEDLEERKRQNQQGSQSGQQSDPPVVDKVAELRMIRAIQARIKRRTAFWNDMRIAGEASAEEIGAALDELAERQARLMRAIRNLDNRARF